MSGDAVERIGLFGGTFDPVHVGHLAAAVTTRHALGLDRVLMVVANVPWQKEGRRAMAPAEDRYVMVAASVDGIDGVEASRIELDRGGESYTADTLEQVVAERPGAALYCVVGADVAAELHTWKRPDTVRRLATLAIVTRAGAGPVEAPPGWAAEHVEIPRLAVSSSDVRARVAAGWPVDGLVPSAAVRWIRRQGLYSG